MKRATFIAGLAAALAVACVAPASAGMGILITVDDDFFDSDDTGQFVPTVDVEWIWDGITSNQHNVREDHKMFRSGPLTSGGQFEIVPPAGTYHYYCENHGTESSGMDGLLRMTPSSTPIDSEDRLRIVWTSGGDTFGDRFDVRYAVGDKPFEIWKSNTTKGFAQFGANDNPVDVKPDKTYRFKVRTKIGGNPKKKSGYSPALVTGVPN